MAAGVPCCLRDGVRFCISFSYIALSISAVTTATERAPSVKHCPSKGMSGVKAFCANVCSVRTQCMPSGGFGTCCSCASQCELIAINTKSSAVSSAFRPEKSTPICLVSSFILLFHDTPRLCSETSGQPQCAGGVEPRSTGCAWRSAIRLRTYWNISRFVSSSDQSSHEISLS